MYLIDDSDEHADRRIADEERRKREIHTHELPPTPLSDVGVDSRAYYPGMNYEGCQTSPLEDLKPER